MDGRNYKKEIERRPKRDFTVAVFFSFSKFFFCLFLFFPMTFTLKANLKDRLENRLKPDLSYKNFEEVSSLLDKIFSLEEKNTYQKILLKELINNQQQIEKTLLRYIDEQILSDFRIETPQEKAALFLAFYQFDVLIKQEGSHKNDYIAYTVQAGQYIFNALIIFTAEILIQEIARQTGILNLLLKTATMGSSLYLLFYENEISKIIKMHTFLDESLHIKEIEVFKKISQTHFMKKGNYQARLRINSFISSLWQNEFAHQMRFFLVSLQHHGIIGSMEDPLTKSLIQKFYSILVLHLVATQGREFREIAFLGALRHVPASLTENQWLTLISPFEWDQESYKAKENPNMERFRKLLQYFKQKSE